MKTATWRIHSLMGITTAGATGNTVGQPATAVLGISAKVTLKA